MRAGFLALAILASAAGCTAEDEPDSRRSVGAYDTGSSGDGMEGATLSYSNGHPLNWLTDDPVALAFEDEVLTLVNRHRVAMGAPALVMDVWLRRAARGHSRHMRADSHNFFAHTNPEGDSPGTRLTRNGISWERMGENIASGYPDPPSVFSGWMNSPGHRANIENAAWVLTGVGYQRGAGSGDYTDYWTQVFVR